VTATMYTDGGRTAARTNRTGRAPRALAGVAAAHGEAHVDGAVEHRAVRLEHVAHLGLRVLVQRGRDLRRLRGTLPGVML
jgi:hypothetical protein